MDIKKMMSSSNNPETADGIPCENAAKPSQHVADHELPSFSTSHGTSAHNTSQYPTPTSLPRLYEAVPDSHIPQSTAVSGVARGKRSLSVVSDTMHNSIYGAPLQVVQDVPKRQRVSIDHGNSLYVPSHHPVHHISSMPDYPVRRPPAPAPALQIHAQQPYPHSNYPQYQQPVTYAHYPHVVAQQEIHHVNAQRQQSPVKDDKSSASETATSSRRIAHIKSEQRRRSVINDGFNELRDVLPPVDATIANTRHGESKAELLKRAAQYIRDLHKQLNASQQKSVGKSGSAKKASKESKAIKATQQEEHEEDQQNADSDREDSRDASPTVSDASSSQYEN
ncbi:hypothetical protein MP228_011951 [Amoeboaphelidium protococcarum]|nr:hypothetical protein MP228_011951 [Amoeboaphelidium protococcarum]